LAEPSPAACCGAGAIGIDDSGDVGAGMVPESWDDGWVLAGGGTCVGGGADELPSGDEDGRGGW
jgi:hypothetical protein